jgi:hypothetical protein
MKYYKFTLGHRGSEVYPFKLNTEQYNTLQEKRVEFDEMGYDEICEVLGVESYFDSPLDSLIGPNPETFYMKVEDEDGNLIYETEQLDPEKCDYEEKYCSQEAYLIIEDYCKGEHLVYNIPLEEEFDPEKIRFEIKDVGCRVEIITEMIYEDEKVDIYKSFGDTSSKGYYYHLTAGI